MAFWYPAFKQHILLKRYCVSDIKLVYLWEIPETQIIDLMNNKEVGKHLPLLSKGFTTKDYKDFITTKKQLWDTHGYGPWAFLIAGKFAGWGGLQSENGEADFALVLHPNFWGWGRKIFILIKDQAFTAMEIATITVLLPPSRLNSKAITRLGFVEEKEVTIGNEVFIRYRLTRP